MMRGIIEASLKARRVVAVLSGLMVLLGIWQLRSMQVDSLPEFTPPTVEVRTEALGLSAPEVEQLITVPLEQDLLAGIPWLDTMRSDSIPGLSSVELVFDPGTDLLRARQVVQERLTQTAGLPNVSGRPQMLQPLASTSRIMMVRLSSKTVSPIEMSVLARWTIRPRLLGVPGVANVSIWGQRERQLQVQVDPDRLRGHGLSLDQIIESSGNALWASPLTFLEASTPGTGGFIDTANQRLGIQHLQPITTAADLAEVPIDGGKDRALRLGDVAEVVEDHQPLIGDAVFTDGVPGLLLVIEKSPGANTLEVTQEAEAALEALRPGLSGIDVDPSVYRPATYVENGIRNLGTALLIGFLLLVLGLGFFLYEWRITLISVASIVASLMAAWLVLYLRGTTVNTILLVGVVMAVAAAIDDAVMGVENVARRLRRRRLEGLQSSAGRIVLEASLETRSAIVYATLISLMAVVPLFFLQGDAAPFVPSIVLSYGLAALTSMVVAVTVTPALSHILLPAPAERPESPILQRLQRRYHHVLAGVIRDPRGMYLGAGAVVLVGLFALPFLRSSPLPSFRDGNVLIDWNAPPGTSLPEMDRITARVGHELASLPGVLEVGAHVGRAVTSDQVVGVDAGQLWVSVDPAADYDATVAYIRRVVDGYPGFDHAVQTYSDARIDSARPATESPIVVRLFGQDPRILRGKAEEVIDAIAGIKGIVHPMTELQPQQPTVNVEVDLQRADRYGIVPGDVRRAAATFLSGIGVGSLFEQQKVFDVVVWGTPDTRNSLSSVRELLIDTPNGRHVPLGQVADVAIASTPTVIKHQDISRSLDVVAGARGRDVGSIAAEVQSRLQDVRFPLEYHAELVGGYAERQAAGLRVLELGVVAAIGIFLLLQAALGSWGLAALLLLALPPALVGGVLAVFLGDRVISLGSLLGTFAVLGITARHGITLIRHYQDIERSEDVQFGPALVLGGSNERLVPMLTSAVAAGFALVPLALSGSAAGQEIVQPMALVILGGLVTSLLLTLFVVPNLYLRFGSATLVEPTRAGVLVLPETDQVPAS